MAKTGAALSLASELLPVSIGDVKDAYKGIKGLLPAGKVAKQLPAGTPPKLLAEKAGPVGAISPSEVLNKTTAQIDTRAKQIGLQARGSNPQAGKGAYIDPQTGTQRILSHPYAPSGPHGHVNTPAGQRVGTKGQVVDPKSQEAHLKIEEE